MNGEEKKEKLNIIFEKLKDILPDHTDEFQNYILLLKNLTTEQIGIVDELYEIVNEILKTTDDETKNKLQEQLYRLQKIEEKEKKSFNVEHIFDNI